MKKVMLIMMAFMLVIAVSGPSIVDAKPRGGFKSGKKFYNTPTKNQDNVQKTDPGKTTTSPGTTSPNRGFFSGGSLMKGLLIGGIAGMLFGGLFSQLGFLGDFLGFMINVLALFFLFVIVRRIVRYFIEQRNLNKKRY
jgi:predicted lipid-binding transport protein (Tim44 family)